MVGGRVVDLLYHFLDGFFQPEAVELIRAEIVRDLAHFLDRLGCGFGYLVKVRFWRAILSFGLEAEQRPIFDKYQALPKTVMQFGGYTLSLALLRFDKL